jgi:hypothetical protein
MSESFPQDCWLYKPGHKTHFIQLNVMRDKERFPADVQLIDLETLEVSYNGQVVQLKTHDAVGVHFDCLHAFENEISFAPEAQLLHVRLSGPTELTEGAWHPMYLARGPMQGCATSDPNSGFFRVPQ